MGSRGFGLGPSADTHNMRCRFLASAGREEHSRDRFAQLFVDVCVRLECARQRAFEVLFDISKSPSTLFYLLQLKKGRVANAKGEGEKQKECITGCESQRRRDKKAPWALNYHRPSADINLRDFPWRFPRNAHENSRTNLEPRFLVNVGGGQVRPRPLITHDHRE